jgi:hypothetical protein
MTYEIDKKYSSYIDKHIESFDFIRNKEKFNFIPAFLNTVYGYRVLIEVLKLNNQSLLGEDNICTKEHLTKVMTSLASRATIINFINDQISAGSLVSNDSKCDGRVKIILPSLELINEFKLWIDVSYS